MTYELALKLKEAGFKQKGNWGDKIKEKGYVRGGIGNGYWLSPVIDENDRDFFDISTRVNQEESVYVPTLSELIQACDCFHSLDKYNKGWSTSGCKEEDVFYETGKTPEEAVANLWLALNKN